VLSLLLATLFSAGFSLVVRYAQGKRCNLWAVGAINYLTATTFHILRAATGEGFGAAPSTLTWGIITGLFYVNSYALLLPFMKLRGVTICMAVSRLAVLVPVMGAVILWAEPVTTLQIAGASLAVVSLPLLGFGQVEGGQRIPLKTLLLMVSLLISNGLGMLAIEAFHQEGIQGQDSLFLAALFGTAAVVSCLVWFLKRQGTTFGDVLPGLMLGLCNALSNLSLVSALDHLPSILVFPFYSAVGVVFTVIFARLMWRERINRLESLGILLAMGAVVFINLV
jgi:multidrug transporter EmrE-like cation transporter